MEEAVASASARWGFGFLDLGVEAGDAFDFFFGLVAIEFEREGEIEGRRVMRRVFGREVREVVNEWGFNSIVGATKFFEGCGVWVVGGMGGD